MVSEDWVMDNFNQDPWAGEAMIQTAENVSKSAGITREQCDALTVRRYQQYRQALEDDRAFQKRYMFPVEIKISRKQSSLVDVDEGGTESTAEGLAKLYQASMSETIWISWPLAIRHLTVSGGIR